MQDKISLQNTNLLLHSPVTIWRGVHQERYAAPLSSRVTLPFARTLAAYAALPSPRILERASLPEPVPKAVVRQVSRSRSMSQEHSAAPSSSMALPCAQNLTACATGWSQGLTERASFPESSTQTAVHQLSSSGGMSQECCAATLSNRATLPSARTLTALAAVPSPRMLERPVVRRASSSGIVSQECCTAPLSSSLALPCARTLAALAALPSPMLPERTIVPESSPQRVLRQVSSSRGISQEHFAVSPSGRVTLPCTGALTALAAVPSPRLPERKSPLESSPETLLRQVGSSRGMNQSSGAAPLSCSVTLPSH